MPASEVAHLILNSETRLSQTHCVPVESDGIITAAGSALFQESSQHYSVLSSLFLCGAI